ncbi:MAG: hypothetical protein NTZ05_20895, partial [Chloroflexi bacterium]|nr:hypothetical protein [Chloroflexota bacterium]
AIERWGAPDTTTAYMIVALVALVAVAAFYPEVRRATLSASDPQPTGPKEGKARPTGTGARS